MNIMTLKRPSHRALWPCALVLLSPVLSGCGGGGGGSTPGPTMLAVPSMVTLSGVLKDARSVPLVGYKVVYTPGAAATAHALRALDVPGTLSAVTDSQGRYTLSIPVSQIAPQSTLSVFDTTGTQVQSQPITLDPIQSVQTTVTTVTPPTPVSPTPSPPTAPTGPGTATTNIPPPPPPTI